MWIKRRVKSHKLQGVGGRSDRKTGTTFSIHRCGRKPASPVLWNAPQDFGGGFRGTRATRRLGLAGVGLVHDRSGAGVRPALVPERGDRSGDRPVGGQASGYPPRSRGGLRARADNTQRTTHDRPGFARFSWGNCPRWGRSGDPASPPPGQPGVRSETVGRPRPAMATSRDRRGDPGPTGGLAGGSGNGTPVARRPAFQGPLPFDGGRV